MVSEDSAGKKQDYLKVEDLQTNVERCLCPNCPTYPVGCREERLYCARGVSRCEIHAAGCLCDECPVYVDYDLRGLYYCDREPQGLSGSVIRKKRRGESAEFHRIMTEIKDVSALGRSETVAMGSRKELPFRLSDLHFVPAQVSKIPLDAEEQVESRTVLGPSSKRPLTASTPIMITGMSFGAVSQKVRIVIARTAKETGCLFNSGEGGYLPEVLDHASHRLIGQYATGRFGASVENLRRVSAVEIRFGQGAYPGYFSLLPGGKITDRIAEVRGVDKTQDSVSPTHHPDMVTSEQVKEKVAWLKDLTNGAPIGAKIGCGNVEEDIEALVLAEVDFISLDGFGGGTGATERFIRDNVGLPIVCALPRADKRLRELGVRESVTLIAGGGLRTSADFARCLSLGADAVYIGTAALMAINCQQYRICFSNLCPTGVTTQMPSLVEQLDVEEGTRRLSNFIRVMTEEMKFISRAVGKKDLHHLNKQDLVSMSRDLAEITGVRWANGKVVNER